jgi:hypothetical protein
MHPAWCCQYVHAAWAQYRLWWLVWWPVKLADGVLFLFHNFIATQISKARIAINAAKPLIKIKMASNVFMFISIIPKLLLHIKGLVHFQWL